MRAWSDKELDAAAAARAEGRGRPPSLVDLLAREDLLEEQRKVRAQYDSELYRRQMQEDDKEARRKGRIFDAEAFFEGFPPEKWEELRLQAERAVDRHYRSHAARRARLKNAPNIEKVDRFVVFDRDLGICHICGGAAQRDDFHLDHVVPLARGGDHTYANIKVSHPDCNVRKGAR